MRKFDSAMLNRVHGQLESWALEVKASAVQNAPSATGYLRSTIYARVKEWVAEVGAEAAYALFVELGTRYMQAQSFLYPALQEHLPALEATITSAIEQAKMEARL